MTYYEKYQTLVDDLTIKAMEGIISTSCAIKIQNYFEEWKSKTFVNKANMEGKVNCSQM